MLNNLSLFGLTEINVFKLELIDGGSAFHSPHVSGSSWAVCRPLPPQRAVSPNLLILDWWTHCPRKPKCSTSIVIQKKKMWPRLSVTEVAVMLTLSVDVCSDFKASTQAAAEQHQSLWMHPLQNGYIYPQVVILKGCSSSMHRSAGRRDWNYFSSHSQF